ncbi:probable protein phosphatase 2C 67 [Zingiber officinale]|uniref:probable protein phosphatase 2C 67 n=1 Tax=Zingiber officinale TaxID=94328 RepID=UPI001C4CFD59|nr:probable protein phosphatase 2C 67 [Zingiber officinale]XP_042458070.1 probable protein phosphatase 2C 67 [Zingiber officinale]
MADHKREASFKNEDLVTKRSKITDINIGLESKNNNGDCTKVWNQSVSDEMNGKKGNNSDEKLFGKADNNSQVSVTRNSSEDVSSHNSVDSKQHMIRVTCIEADAAEDKGSRHTMEDAWVVLLDASLETPGKLRCAHFSIYDGHGGRMAAEYAQKHLHPNVLAAGLPRELMDIKVAKKAIIEGFRKTDESLFQESAKGNWQDGATAVCVWVLGEMVLIANIGDAKAVLARSVGEENSQALSDKTRSQLKAIVVTREHKAIYPQERARIQKAGGSVSSNGRLQGRLEVSRAFGDRQFKKVGVIAIPDVHSFELTEREHFMILGCDGLWGVFGPSDAVDFVQKQLQDTGSATTAARRLVREAVRERQCKDNCTALVILFKHVGGS